MVDKERMLKKLNEVFALDEELANALINVKDSYDHFVIGIFARYKEYPDLKEKILDFIAMHNDANPSDITLYYTEEFLGFKRKSKYSWEE